MTESPFTELRQMWVEAEAKQKDWRTKGEAKLLEQMHDAYAGLKSLGWREITYATQKDGSRILGCSAASCGIFVHVLMNGGWWAESAGDLWPARPELWKPIPDDEVPA